MIPCEKCILLATCRSRANSEMFLVGLKCSILGNYISEQLQFNDSDDKFISDIYEILNIKRDQYITYYDIHRAIGKIKELKIGSL